MNVRVTFFSKRTDQKIHLVQKIFFENKKIKEISTKKT